MAWFGSLEWRLRNVNVKVQDTMNKDEVEHLINLKLEVLQYMHTEIRNETKLLNLKIDKLLEKK